MTQSHSQYHRQLRFEDLENQITEIKMKSLEMIFWLLFHLLLVLNPMLQVKKFRSN